MLSVTFLGTSAARPTVERNVTSTAVVREGETFLFDCGEGTQRQMMRYGISFAFSEIFITHFHADHYLGVVGLLRTLGLQGREEPVKIHGPKGIERILGSSLSGGIERVPFEVELIELAPGNRLERKDYDLEIFETTHGAHSIGYSLVEHLRLGRFDPDRARELGVPEGPLWGRLHRGEAVTLEDGRVVEPDGLVGDSRPGRKVVICGDTRPSERVVAAAEGADLLVHEATFSDEEAERARETDHSTASEAAKVALAAHVKRLVLNHLSARFSRDFGPLLEEAREVFPETVVAQDGMVLEVDYPSV